MSTFGMSAWFGTWLAIEFPNPCWHRPMCSKSLKLMPHMRHCVSVNGMHRHLHVCGMPGEQYVAMHMLHAHPTWKIEVICQSWCDGASCGTCQEPWSFKIVCFSSRSQLLTCWLVLVNLNSGRVIGCNMPLLVKRNARRIGTSWD